MKALNRFIAVATVALLLGCSPEAALNAKPDAEKLAARFFEYLKTSQFEKAMPLYDERFWTAIPQETWLKILKNIAVELGPLKDCTLSNWTQNTKAGTASSGTFVNLIYSCQHEKYDATVSFITQTPLEGGGTTIINQTYNSIGFLLE